MAFDLHSYANSQNGRIMKFNILLNHIHTFTKLFLIRLLVSDELAGFHLLLGNIF